MTLTCPLAYLPVSSGSSWLSDRAREEGTFTAAAVLVPLRMPAPGHGGVAQPPPQKNP